PLELPVAPRAAVQGVRGQGRRHALTDHLVVRVARLAKPIEPEERLGLPETRLAEAAGRRREGRCLLERVEGGEIRLLREAGLAQQQRRLGNAPILRVAVEEPLELAARQR